MTKKQCKCEIMKKQIEDYVKKNPKVSAYLAAATISLAVGIGVGLLLRMNK